MRSGDHCCTAHEELGSTVSTIGTKLPIKSWMSYFALDWCMIFFCEALWPVINNILLWMYVGGAVIWIMHGTCSACTAAIKSLRKIASSADGIRLCSASRIHVKLLNETPTVITQLLLLLSSHAFTEEFQILHWLRCPKMVSNLSDDC